MAATDKKPAAARIAKPAAKAKRPARLPLNPRILAVLEDGGRLPMADVEAHDLSARRGFVHYDRALTVSLPADVPRAVIVGFELLDAGKLANRGMVIRAPFALEAPHSLGISAGTLIWRMA